MSAFAPRYCCGCFALMILPVSHSLQTTVPFEGWVQTVLISCLSLSRTSVAKISTTFRGSLIPAIPTKLCVQRGHAVVLTGRTPPRHLDRQGVLPLLPALFPRTSA